MNDLAYNSLFCDHSNFGVFEHPSSFMNNNNQQFFSTDFDMSTGRYLQDALVDKFHDRSKKRRLFFYSDQNHSYWDDSSSFNLELYENLNYFTKIDLYDELRDNSTTVSEEAKNLGAIKKHEDEMLGFDREDEMFSSQDSYNKENSVDSANSSVSSMQHSGEETSKKMKKSGKVYPFSVVKPGGINEGEVTLNEINERISKPLARRVKHPVGEYACKPNVMSLNGGPGLSGKAVVSLTRIHTLGRGTITIIRTKG